MSATGQKNIYCKNGKFEVYFRRNKNQTTVMYRLFDNIDDAILYRDECKKKIAYKHIKPVDEIDGEVWSKIEYSDNHMISNMGRVKSLDYDSTGFESLMLPIKNDYLRISIKGKTFSIHRLVWEAFVGKIPDGFIVNHKDLNKYNNNVANLECISKRDNNIHYYSTKTGHYGYCFDKTKKKWVSAISVNGKRIHIGYFETPEDARLARVKKLNELGIECKYV